MDEEEMAVTSAAKALLFFKQHATNPAEAFICQQALGYLKNYFTCLQDFEL